jgi:hypothetical protein
MMTGESDFPGDFPIEFPSQCPIEFRVRQAGSAITGGLSQERPGLTIPGEPCNAGLLSRRLAGEAEIRSSKIGLCSTKTEYSRPNPRESQSAERALNHNGSASARTQVEEPRTIHD